MEFLLFLLQSWEKAVIAIAILVFVLYVLLVYYSLSSCFKFKNMLRSYEISMKMSIIETITSIKELAALINFQFDEETIKKIDEIETLAGQDIVTGYYKEVNTIYMDLLNYAKHSTKDSELLEKVKYNSLRQNEINNLYQKALFYHSQDLIGYNYWVKFVLTRPFTKAFKFNKKESVY